MARIKSKPDGCVDLIGGARRGFREMEEQIGAKEIQRRMGMSAKQVKRIWNDFSTDDQPKELGLR